MGDLLESGKWHSHDGDAGIQRPDWRERNLASDHAGEKRGQDYGGCKKGTAGRKLNADGHGYGRYGKRPRKRNQGIQGNQAHKQTNQKVTTFALTSRAGRVRAVSAIRGTTTPTGPSQGLLRLLPTPP